jgi:hypothetical protein
LQRKVAAQATLAGLADATLPTWLERYVQLHLFAPYQVSEGYTQRRCPGLRGHAHRASIQSEPSRNASHGSTRISTETSSGEYHGAAVLILQGKEPRAWAMPQQGYGGRAPRCRPRLQEIVDNCALRLPLEDTAVDDQLLACHVGGGVGGEVQDAGSDILGLPLALERHRLLYHRFLILAPAHEFDRGLVERGVDPTRTHAVGADVVRGKLCGQGPGERNDRPLGGGVGGHPGAALEAGKRGDIHDGTAPLSLRYGTPYLAPKKQDLGLTRMRRSHSGSSKSVIAPERWAPAAIISEDWGERKACVYCGFCRDYGCHVGAKTTTLDTMMPRALATAQLEHDLKLHPLSRK